VAGRGRIEAGDIIAVPFAKGKVAVGLVLHHSREFFSRCLLVGFCDQVFDSIETIEPENIGGPFIATPQYLHQWSIRKGIWPRIGHREDLLSMVKLPILRVSYDLYQGDTHVGRVGPDELRDYPELGVQGDGYVEGVLQHHFLND
jgi:hypothetical protein